MRGLIIILLLVVIEARKRKLHRNDEKPSHRTKPKGPDEDVYEAPNRPVDFGHIFREGFEDPSAGFKQPMDFLELTMVAPQNEKEAKEMFEMAGGNVKYTSNKKQKPMGFSNPRDKYLHFEPEKLNEDANDSKESNRDKMRRIAKSRVAWLDLPSIHTKNIAIPIGGYGSVRKKADAIITNTGPYEMSRNVNEGPKTGYFADKTFDINSEQNVFSNWTTCDEFARGSYFNPDDIVDLDWVPFFVWTTRPYVAAIVHRFSFPTKKLVKKYKEEIGPYLNNTVDWEGLKMHMNESQESLLIAVDRKGLFQAIPYQPLPDSMKGKGTILPVFTLRLKIVDPYLALMHCEERYALIMTVSGNDLDTTKEKREESLVLKFRGKGFPVTRDVEGDKLKLKAIERQRQENEDNKFINVAEDPYAYRSKYFE